MPIPKDAQGKGDEAMDMNGIETVYRDGRHWETMKSAARRYGVSESLVKDGIGKELFWADDPETGIRVVGGVLSKQGDWSNVPFWTVVEYVIGCPTNRVLPNLVWFGVWGTVVMTVMSKVDIFAGICLSVILGIVKLVYAVKWEKEHPQEVKSVVWVDDGYCGGDGFFDEVSTRRRSDIQFLMGTGPFAR